MASPKMLPITVFVATLLTLAGAWMLLADDGTPSAPPQASLAAGTAGSSGSQNPGATTQLDPSRRGDALGQRTTDGERLQPNGGADRSGATDSSGRATPLPPGTRRASGHVLRLADRSPLVGAQLSSSYSATTSDDGGRFELAGVAPGDKALAIQLGTVMTTAALPGRSGDLDGIELIVDTGWIIAGQVFGPGAQAVGGATVAAHDPQSDALLATTTSDSNGHYRLLDVLPLEDNNLSLSAFGSDYARRSVRLTVFDDVRVVDGVLLSVAAGGSLAGRVTDTHGQGLADVRVATELIIEGALARATDAPAWTLSEADGSYNLLGLDENAYVVSFSEPRPDLSPLDSAFGVAPSSSLGQSGSRPPAWLAPVIVTAGRTTRLDAPLPIGSSLAGTVVDQNGQLVPGAEVEVRRVLHWGQSAASVFSTRIGEIEVGPNIDGIPGTELTAPLGVVTANHEARFALPSVPDCELLLRVSHPAFPDDPPSEQRTRISTGNRVENMTLVIQLRRQISGTVTDDQGQPLPGVLVVAMPQKPGNLLNPADGVRSDESGSFTLGAMPEGPLQLRALAPGYEGGTAELTAEQTTVDLVLRPVPALSGTVTDAHTGAALQQFTVEARAGAHSVTRVFDDYRGQFLIDNRPAEAHELQISADGYLTATIVNERPNLQRFELQVELIPDGS